MKVSSPHKMKNSKASSLGSPVKHHVRRRSGTVHGEPPADCASAINGGSTSAAAYVLATILIAIDDHNATATSPVVPALTAPAAVPASISGLVRAARERALGQWPLVVSGWRRIRDVLLSDIPACLAARRILL